MTQPNGFIIMKATTTQFLGIQALTDPTLFPLEEYNQLFIDKVFLKHKVLAKYLQEFSYVQLDLTFLQAIEAKLHQERGERHSTITHNQASMIDLNCPSAMLATNFSSQPEFEDDTENGKQTVIAFETKPKSGVVEYVPSKVIKYLEDNSQELSCFNAKSVLKEQFISCGFSKYHIMQVSRMYKGKLSKLSKYSPRDFFNEISLEKSLKDLIEDRQIYGRVFMNGQEIFELNDDKVKMISYFLTSAEIIQALADFQQFSMLSMEYVLSCYQLVAPELLDEVKRETHFKIIRKIFHEFDFDKLKVKANKMREQFNLDDITLDQDTLEDIWSIVIGYLISATAKDFTIIIRIVDNIQVKSDEDRQCPLKNEQILEYQGKLFKVRIGVIDLEGKMYTKLPVYMREAEEAYMNFVKYHNQN
eukprot:403343712